MNDHDARQLAEMRGRISSYVEKKISLQALIGDLLFLRDAMSNVEAVWERELTGRIADLESAYTYALEKNSGELESISQGVVDKAIPRLLELVAEDQAGGL